jgi:hypothetical protein
VDEKSSWKEVWSLARVSVLMVSKVPARAIRIASLIFFTATPPGP